MNALGVISIRDSFFATIAHWRANDSIGGVGEGGTTDYKGICSYKNDKLIVVVVVVVVIFFLMPPLLRWSKPHVSTPGLAGLLQLRRLLKTGITSLHLAAADYPAICRCFEC